MPRRAKTFWLSQDSDPMWNVGSIEVWSRKPTRKEGKDLCGHCGKPSTALYSERSGRVADFEACDDTLFERVTGIAVKPGQLVEVRLEIVARQ